MLSCGGQKQNFGRLSQVLATDYFLTSMLKWERFIFFSSRFLVISLPTSFKARQDNVVFGTCGKDTAPTQVSIGIQNEVFSESAHCLLTARLCGSAVQLLVLLNRGVIKHSLTDRPLRRKGFSAWELFVTH